MGTRQSTSSAKRYRTGAVAALLCVLLGQVFLIFGIGESLTELSYDIPFAFRSDIKTSEAVLVYMDEESHHQLGQEHFDRWDRTLHARLIDSLKALGARAVVFDILFSDHSNPTADESLVRAVTNHGNVFVAGMVGSEVHNDQVIGTKPVRPFPELAAAARGWGMVENWNSSDAVVREHYNGALAVPSLNWIVATQFIHQVDLDNQSPRRWMNYYGPAGTIPWVSYYRVLSNAVSPNLISNRVVYVGGLYSIGWTGGKGTDDNRTPYSRWDREHRKSPGVELNATAFLNLVRGDWLRRSSPVQEVIGITLLGAALGFGLMSLRPISAAMAGVAFALLLAVAGWVLMWQARLWTPWMIPVAVQLPLALLCCLVSHSQKASESSRPLKQTAEGTPPEPAAPLATGQLAQELGALRAAQSPIVGGVVGPGTEPRVSTPTIPDHELIRCVGKGAYGEVWLARTILGGYRAAKLIYRRTFPEAQPYEREFDGIRHFEPISRSHECLVPILHVGRDDEAGYFFYLMEPADDMDRTDSIRAETYTPRTLSRDINRRGAFPLAECIELAHSLALGLGFLHDQGLLHRDIKPSNIIFIKGVPKLADIGLVTPMDESISFVGTQGYFPPEGPGTPSADLFSLGKVLYQCLTGLPCSRFPELPTKASTEQGRNFGRFNDLILKACHPEAKKRYQSAGEFCADLAKLRGSAKRGWFR